MKKLLCSIVAAACLAGCNSRSVATKTNDGIITYSCQVLPWGEEYDCNLTLSRTDGSKTIYFIKQEELNPLSSLSMVCEQNLIGKACGKIENLTTRERNFYEREYRKYAKYK